MLRRLVQDVERKLPPKITIAMHCPFSAYQAAVYDWVNKTGTLRCTQRCPRLASLRDKTSGIPRCRTDAWSCGRCATTRSELPHRKGRRVENGEDLVRTCGKLWMLDRMLIKLRAAGHRVLLFSTMTKLLDLLETYLKWRMTTPAGEGMEWCRIDGSTALDLRGGGHHRVQRAGFQKFIFLLSIRAAGRGSQPPDRGHRGGLRPGPKPEERGAGGREVASHRSAAEVRVLYMEAVMDEIGAADDEGGIGGSGHGGAGKGGHGAVCSPTTPRGGRAGRVSSPRASRAWFATWCSSRKSRWPTRSSTRADSTSKPPTRSAGRRSRSSCRSRPGRCAVLRVHVAQDPERKAREDAAGG